MQQPYVYWVGFDDSTRSELTRLGRQILASERLRFQMWYGGCKSSFTEADYREIVRVILAAHIGAITGGSVEVRVFEFRAQQDESAELDMVNVLRDLGPERLRILSDDHQKFRVRGWLNQEAEILEMD